MGIAGCLGLVFTFTDVGLIIRVALSESSLVAYASEVRPDTATFSHDPRLVGLFLVDGEDSCDGIVLLYTSQSFLNREGLAYVPPGTAPPDQISRHRFRYLFGQWYWLSWKF